MISECIIFGKIHRYHPVKFFCKVLEKLVKSIKKKPSINDSQEILKDLQMVSGHLLRTEKHHIREEHTFIRRLVSMAEYDPSQEIRKQHDNLGVLKRNLESTIYGIYTSPFDQFQKDLQFLVLKVFQALLNNGKKLRTYNNTLQRTKLCFATELSVSCINQKLKGERR